MPEKPTATSTPGDRRPAANGDNAYRAPVEQGNDLSVVRHSIVAEPAANGLAGTAAPKIRKIGSFRMTKVYADGEFV